MHDEPIETFLARQEKSSTGQIGKSLGVALRMEAEEQKDASQWGRFEPAIRQWETILRRPAPEPTKPDGRNGEQRLNPQFTEWLMGLAEGWITDCGLSRAEQLKACGNGVVPQQALLALQLLDVKL